MSKSGWALIEARDDVEGVEFVPTIPKAEFHKVLEDASGICLGVQPFSDPELDAAPHLQPITARHVVTGQVVRVICNHQRNTGFGTQVNQKTAGGALQRPCARGRGGSPRGSRCAASPLGQACPGRIGASASS